MKIYISWSGERSKSVARILRQFISTAFQNVEIFFSVDDIVMGENWIEEASRRLTESDVGILCITSDNIDNPWISFEAGALYSRGKVLIPVLLDLSSADLYTPLANFQSISLTRSGVQSILELLNNQLENPQNPEYINKVFNKLWSAIEQEIDLILPAVVEYNTESSQPELRSERELLYELLERVKNLELKASQSE
ncbi:MAG: toll/interleukin-1 receptor domain-containing protein [Cyanobacteria bacterium J06621_8]